MYSKIKFWLIFFMPVIAGCGQNNPHEVNVSDIEAEVELKRFEKDFFAINEEHFREEFLDLKNKYPDKAELMVEQILGFGRIDDKTDNYIRPLQHRFYGDEYIRELNEDIQEKYDEETISKLEEELTDAFKHLRYYYPDAELPDLHTTLTSFTYSVITYEELMAISLDMYMGEDYKFYPSLDFPSYKLRRMNEHYITPDVLTSWALNEYPESEYTDNSLLSKMIYEGKLLYFLDVMMPRAHDSLKIQYTSDQLNWSEHFESKIWSYFVEEDMLFKTENHILDRYLEDGPFTSSPGFSQESPPRLGAWAGWRIVRSYMKNNEEVTLHELMENREAERILQASGYRP